MTNKEEIVRCSFLSRCTYQQLSSDGQRLFELNALNGDIDDLKINPHDCSIIALQRYQNNIILYDSLGNQMTNGKQVYDPIKVFIY